MRSDECVCIFIILLYTTKYELYIIIPAIGPIVYFFSIFTILIILYKVIQID